MTRRSAVLMATAAYHTQPTRPTTAAVLAYLAAGHSNAEAAQHFGIHERSVRRIKQRASERNCAATQVSPGESIPLAEHAPCSPVRQSSDLASPAPIFPDTADDVAGDHTMWKCPATGELMPVIPGRRRKDWERDRVETHARHVAAVMSSSTVRTQNTTSARVRADRTGQQPLTAWQSERTGPDSGVIGAYVAGPDRTAVLRSSDELDPQGDDVPLVTEDQELLRAPIPPEPQPSIPTSPADNNPLPVKPLDPARDPRIYQPNVPRDLNTMGLNTTPVQRVIVRVPEPRQMGGLVGWLASGPMFGPVPVWALLLLAFGALLVQLGLLG